ncbi:hypothetical protein JOD57_003801 [Geodermatophilus bullaregiensis]|uniref:hypothetical protein n=1 Tax=Geodermatophilus bullaregiensis TaxID=1564160 RepID=UPI00195CAA73|nr:hypothetical protein [Geodermatophilus bullaregiensis]MBM7807964.1 hypothetical protein [Geodermatophilus bullaregiensis]
MRTGPIIRRAAVALAAAVMTAVTVPGQAQAAVFPPDPVRLTAPGVDFGDNTFVLGAPLGSGSVNWAVNQYGFYQATLTGRLHLDNVPLQYGRMHMEYFDGAGTSLGTIHGGKVRAPNNNSHVSWSVDLRSPDQLQVVQVEICTETSSNGTSWSQSRCTGRLLL